MECKHCGMANDTDAQFCVGCGQVLEQTPTGEEMQQPEPQVTEEITCEQPSVKKKSKKGFIFAGVGVLLAAALALGAYFLFFRKEKTCPSALYIKDGNLYYYNMQTDTVLELTDDLTRDDETSVNFSYYTYLNMIQYSQDRSRVFFPEKVQLAFQDGQPAGQFTLCYLDVNAKDAAPKKVASDVSYYLVSEKGDKVAYMKGTTLYISDLQEEEKIAKDVLGRFMATPDLSKIGYMNDENNLYLWQEGKDKEKIASAVASVVYLEEDFSFMYYLNDEHSLYKQEYGKAEKEKIASDVENVYYFTSGEMYYTQVENTTLFVKDYVVDDMAEADSKMEAPTMPSAPEETAAPEKPLSYEFDDEESYQAALSEYEQALQTWETENAKVKEEYETLLEAYEQEKDLYIDKQARDAMRDQLEDKTVEQQVKSLYYYDGKESILVTDRLRQITQNAVQKAVVIALIQTPATEPEILLSELEYIDDADTAIQEYLRGNYQTVLITGKTLSAEKLEDAGKTVLTYSGKTAYYFQEKATEEDTTYDLYKLDVKSGKAELYDTEVFDCFIPAETEDVYYWKNVTREAPNAEMSQGGYTSLNFGDLYFNKKLVVEEAPIRSVEYAQGALYYYTDYDQEKSYGTLHRYQDGKDTVISEEVHTYTLAVNGEVLYLYDFSQKRQNGTLYRYNNGKPKLIDEEVQTIVPDYAYWLTYYKEMLRGG